ncbi:MAG: ATP-binding protein [Coriobacteriales bacterium]|jgi:DNA replication protein DnaC|nr:ATP-binding protein [Coriobacteriales bacterium]
MIDNETMMKMRAMRISGMAECLENLSGLPDGSTYTTSDVIKMMVDYEWDRRQNSKLKKLQAGAHLAQPYASVSDIRIVADRKLDTELISRLSIGKYLVNYQDVVLQCPIGSGKTFVACALANRACQQFKRVLYITTADLFDRLSLAERQGERKRALESLVKIELLVIDDWFLKAPTMEQVQNLHTLIDRRHRKTSTSFCTQLSQELWHERMEEKVLADAIVDRIVTNLHKTELGTADIFLDSA